MGGPNKKGGGRRGGKGRGSRRQAAVGLTRQPNTRCVLFGNALLNFGTSVLQSAQISSSVWLAARFVNYSTCFLNVRVKRVTIEPIQLAVNQYIEYALLPSHLPALLSGFDATPAAPLATSSIMTLPGAKRAQQGNNLPPRCSMRCPKTMEFACGRVASDSPPVGFIVGYSTVNTIFNIWVEVVFKGYNTVS